MPDPSPSTRVAHTAAGAVAVGPYSHAVDAGFFVVCSGQTPLDSTTGKLKALDPAATDGTENAVGVLAADVDATLIDREDALLISRHAIVANHALAWPVAITSTEKTAAMAAYFAQAAPADAAWAVYFLSGGRPKRLIPVRRLSTWAMELASVPEWLFAECYDAVGDLAETIALLLPAVGSQADDSLASWIRMQEQA